MYVYVCVCVLCVLCVLCVVCVVLCCVCVVCCVVLCVCLVTTHQSKHFPRHWNIREHAQLVEHVCHEKKITVRIKSNYALHAQKITIFRCVALLHR